MFEPSSICHLLAHFHYCYHYQPWELLHEHVFHVTKVPNMSLLFSIIHLSPCRKSNPYCVFTKLAHSCVIIGGVIKQSKSCYLGYVTAQILLSISKNTSMLHSANCATLSYMQTRLFSPRKLFRDQCPEIMFDHWNFCLCSAAWSPLVWQNSDPSSMFSFRESRRWWAKFVLMWSEEVAMFPTHTVANGD